MPHYRNPFDKGDLYVKFEVQFPENNWISPEKLAVRYVTLHFYTNTARVETWI